MQPKWLLTSFLLAGCGPAFTVKDLSAPPELDSGTVSDAPSGPLEAAAKVDGFGIEAGAEAASLPEAAVEASENFDASPDSGVCTTIPFQARSGCPSAAACSSCGLLYAPVNFWLGCSQVDTPKECQCAETYNCACLLAHVACQGTLLCDVNAAAPALFLRCVP